MGASEVKAERAGDRVAIAIALVLPIAILGLWWAPRAATPTELPALALPRADVRAALAADAVIAEGAPSSEAETARRELYLEEGRAEVRADDSVASAAGRAEALALALGRVAEEHGENGVAAARMADVLRLERALAGEGTPTERAAEAGRFEETLERWGAVDESRRIAPPIVVRALGIARWNAVFTRPLTEGMSPLHVRAYHGWLALHGAVGWTDLRAVALDRYEEAGGRRAIEARAVLVLRSGEPELARSLFERAYERVGSVRLRNLALGALERSAAEP